MGSSDKHIGRDFDSGFDGTHKMRLRASVAWATIPEGESEIPAEAFFDFHGTDDVAISADDWKRLDLVCDLAAELCAVGGPTACMPALDAADTFWPGFKSWLLSLGEPDMIGLLTIILSAGGAGARRLG